MKTPTLNGSMSEGDKKLSFSVVFPDRVIKAVYKILSMYLIIKQI